MARPAMRSLATPRKVMLEPRTCRVCGICPNGSTCTNGWFAYQLQKDSMQLLRRCACAAADVDRREDAAVHRHQMRREADDHLAAGGLGEFLVELRHVPVMADAIGVDAFGDFREQHLLLGRPPAPVMPDLASMTISSGSIALARSSGISGKLRAGRVAAGIGDEMRALDLVAIDLDQAVDRLPLQLRRVVLVAVPARVARRGRRAGSRPTDRPP